MKTKFVAPILLITSLAAYGHNAMASDEFAGALIGAGTGAVLGQVIGGRDGAFVGGFIGAMLGAASADDDDRYPVLHAPRRDFHVPPVTVYQAPRAHFMQPALVTAMPQNPWRHAQFERRDYRGDRDRNDWREERTERFGERGDRHNERGDRRGW